jgi:hypothetical protein
MDRSVTRDPLKLETEKVSETLDTNSTLTRVTVQEGFVA